MCTNYVPSSRDLIREHLQIQLPTFDYVDELWPGYKGPLLIGGLEWRLAMFGMVPYFSKDGKDFRKTSNARAETADVRPTYRGPWRRRQLGLVPMEAFFEPNYESGKPVRWRIERQDKALFTVAALWDTWRPSEGEILHSFSMLTINADGHPLMSYFHAPGDEKRSLAIVPAEKRDEWLAAGDPREFLLTLPADQFMASPAPLPPRKPKLPPAESDQQQLSVGGII